MSVLLKNSVIPKAVNAAPEDRKMTPNLRLPDVSTVGSFDLDDDDDEGFLLFFEEDSFQYNVIVGLVSTIQ